jgi:endonuclease/exonuclease/phosphatase family metal-dependent hydrolase
MAKAPLKLFFLFLFFFIIIVFVACNKRVNNGNDDLPPEDRISIPTFGTDSTLDIASWNIEFFPKLNGQTIENVREIIKDLEVDLFALQEITEVNSFQRILDSLPDYDGKVANGAGSFPLWPAIIYNKKLISISNEELLFRNDTYNFPRAPYSVYISYSNNNQSLNFTLIVLHLKARGDAESVQRRKDAIIKLEDYVKNKIMQGGDPDYVIAGDWNDELGDVQDNNVFVPFLKDSLYSFLTEQYDKRFKQNNTDYSFIGGNFQSLIDHIMITAAIDTLYNHQTQILKLDQFFTQYESEVSDHRPVASQLFVF